MRWLAVGLISVVTSIGVNAVQIAPLQVHLEKQLRNWQKRLGLDTWNLSIQLVRKSALDKDTWGNVEGLVSLMTEDHVFIDGLGNRVSGREEKRAAWQQYFAMCPDYHVSVEHGLEAGPVVGLFGSAGGTIKGKRWQIPAAWLALVEA